MYTRYFYKASKAIDGNLDGILDHKHCARMTHWWKVILPELVIIEAVVITDRTDCCGE